MRGDRAMMNSVQYKSLNRPKLFLTLPLSYTPYVRCSFLPATKSQIVSTD